MLQTLRQCRHWVFDMDGTLTCAVHDFDWIRRQLDIPPQADILGHLHDLPADEAARAHDWLLQHELELARAATAAPGAVELVQALAARGDRLAILTRNAHELVQVTLDTIGLGDTFESAAILGREQARPKPHPEGMQKIAAHWQVPASRLCMIGDFHFDLSSARSAGARAILVNRPDNPWPELADLHAADCGRLRALLLD